MTYNILIYTAFTYLQEHLIHIVQKLDIKILGKNHWLQIIKPRFLFQECLRLKLYVVFRRVDVVPHDLNHLHRPVLCDGYHLFATVYVSLHHVKLAIFSLLYLEQLTNK